MPTIPAPSPLARHWTIDPSVCYLNHGSFGACPRVVLEEQARLRALMEAEAVRFFVEKIWDLSDAARRAVSELMGCDWRSVAPMPNATIGVATVLGNLTLRAGDEVLAFDQEYPACRNNFARFAERFGASVTTPTLPTPVSSEGEVVDALVRAVTPKTRAALVSHVTSVSGLVLPIERMVSALRERGVITIVDGAHAPAFTPTNIEAIGCDFYTANLHKWLCTPKGSAFLYVREGLRDGFRPLVLSNYAGLPRPGREQFLTEFDYIGTDDRTAFMCVPRALAFLKELRGTLADHMRQNRGLALRARDMLCARLGTEPCAPDSMIGCMALVALPRGPRHEELRARPTRYADALQDALVDRWSIQVPINVIRGERFVRISAQAYNSVEQYEYLGDALEAELARERTM